MEYSQPDLLPDVISRKKLYVLLVDSLAVKGISELDLFDKTSITEDLLLKIREMDMDFKFSRSYLQRLAPYLLQVEAWEELRPVFRLPYISYQGWLNNLIEDLQVNQLIAKVTG